MLREAVQDWVRERFDHTLAVEPALDPQQAVRLASGDGPSLVLVDIDAPQSLGFALLRSLEELPTAPALLAMTVYEDAALHQAALAAGADGCICLLHTNATLRAVVEALLQSPLGHPQGRRPPSA